MEKQKLLDSLDALRAEIAKVKEVDPQMLAELRRLTDEIRRETGMEEPTSTEEATDVPQHGLKSWLLQFEADHPQFSVAVGKVADALAAMGF